MQYRALADLYERLEGTSKKLEKRDLLAEFYRQCPKDDLYTVVLLSEGLVFPTGTEDLGMSDGMIKRVIVKASGASEKILVGSFKKSGDLGIVAETLIQSKKQTSFLKKELTVQKVFENLRKLPTLMGTGSQERKQDLVLELIAAAQPKEVRYVVRTILGDLRIGVAAGIVRDAIATAFDQEPRAIEDVYNLLGDYGRVALLAKEGVVEARIEVGKPIRVMLAERGADLKTALESFDRPALEVKYDGFRVCIHKDSEKIWIFSRRLDDVTKQFPDIASWARECLQAKQCIVDGEALAVDPKTRASLPFQQLSRRIQRKYDIERMVKEIPVQVNLFDVIYIDGKNYMAEPLDVRWQALQKLVDQKKGSFQTAGHLETNKPDQADAFYKAALAHGDEGIIVKNRDAHYQPGRRVGFWIKVKDILEPLDLVVVGAEWGEGKRAQWFGSLILAAQDTQGNFVSTGRMASGLTEDQMEMLTKKLKKLVIKEEGKIVELKSSLVLEVGYEEIQQSSKYPSGFALRFPRLLRLREGEKNPEDANTVADIEKLFKQQRSRNKK